MLFDREDADEMALPLFPARLGAVPGTADASVALRELEDERFVEIIEASSPDGVRRLGRLLRFPGDVRGVA